MPVSLLSLSFETDAASADVCSCTPRSRHCFSRNRHSRSGSLRSKQILSRNIHCRKQNKKKQHQSICNNINDHETYTCAVVSSALMTSRLVPSAIVSHLGKLFPPAGRLVAAFARVVPSRSQSSPLPPTTSVSWLNDVPVLRLYPHCSLPLCSSASSLCSLKERAPRGATEGANPECYTISIRTSSKIGEGSGEIYNRRLETRQQARRHS